MNTAPDRQGLFLWGNIAMKALIAVALAFAATAAQADEHLNACPEFCRDKPDAPYGLICVKQNNIVQLLKRNQPGDDKRIQELQSELTSFLASNAPRADANPKECKIPAPK